MTILIIGSGGREHALAHAYSKNPKVKKVIVAPGNDFMMTTKKVITKPDITVFDKKAIVVLAKKEAVTIVDVAQDDPLADGLIDTLRDNGITAFGPTKAAAEIEWNKEWSREFMKKYNLPIPKFASFTDQKKAITHIQSLPEQPLFIKAAGLAAGKGALKALNSTQAVDAVVAMSMFGEAGKTFLIEECITGEEFSLFAICDGNSARILGVAQDHKTINNRDEGANTGGMGCVAPTTLLTKKMIAEVEQKILKPFMKGMKKERRPYIGILYVGGMVTKGGIKIIEFNARWGDSEAEVILPGITTDYLKIINAALRTALDKIAIKIDNKTRVSITGASAGYPLDTSAVNGKKVQGITSASKQKGVTLYGAAIKKKGTDYYADGGRVLHVIAEGVSIQEARERGYAAISQLSIQGNNLHYRTDIGWRELERKQK